MSFVRMSIRSARSLIIVTLNTKGCICHFAKWQIRTPFHIQWEVMSLLTRLLVRHSFRVFLLVGWFMHVNRSIAEYAGLKLNKCE